MFHVQEFWTLTHVPHGNTMRSRFFFLGKKNFPKMKRKARLNANHVTCYSGTQTSLLRANNTEELAAGRRHCVKVQDCANTKTHGTFSVCGLSHLKRGYSLPHAQKRVHKNSGGQLAACLWIYTEAAICNCQNNMDDSMDAKRNSVIVIEAVSWGCRRVLPSHESVSEFHLDDA